MMKKKKDTDKATNKKMIAIRMSHETIRLLNEFTKRFPGMTQGGIVEVGLNYLKKASDEDLKNLFPGAYVPTKRELREVLGK